MARPRATAADKTCGQCGLQLNRKCDLRRHMAIHSPDKESLMHPCPHPGCTYKALQKSNLRTHFNQHTGLRPYKCPVEGCTFRVSDPSSLAQHRKKIHGYVSKRSGTKRAAGATVATEMATTEDLAVNDTPATLDTETSSSTPLDTSMGSEQLMLNYTEVRETAATEDLVLNDTPAVLNADISPSTPSGTLGFQMGSEKLTLDYTDFPGLEEEKLQAVSFPTRPIAELTSPEMSNATFDELLAQWTHSQAPPPSVPDATFSYDTSLPTLPAPPNTIDSNFASSADLFTKDYDYSLSDALVASGSRSARGSYSSTSITPRCDYVPYNAGYGHDASATNVVPFYSLASTRMAMFHQNDGPINPYLPI